jgi:hypothetical protein
VSLRAAAERDGRRVRWSASTAGAHRKFAGMHAPERSSDAKPGTPGGLFAIMRHCPQCSDHAPRRALPPDRRSARHRVLFLDTDRRRYLIFISVLGVVQFYPMLPPYLIGRVADFLIGWQRGDSA